jgi:manganese oxidase
MTTRRNILTGAAFLGASVVSKAALGAVPEPAVRKETQSAAPLPPGSGRPYHPVVTLNGWSLPFRIRNGWKEFHLVAEPVEREFAPGMVARLWGYNGQSPGPTIEVVEGDKVRIFVTNKLPEHTTIHWHGQRLPNGMDGVGGLNQPHIKPGKTFVYEFVARRPGTFMYHPHADEMVQMAMGMMGFWVTHPRDPNFMRVDRDFVFLLSAYDVIPGSAVPRVNTMLDFNLWTWNSRVFPGIDPLVVRLGDRVRIRVGNLTMTNHPIHLHGHEFVITGTDGGWTPPASRWPEITADIAVGQMRALEFIADEPGDWAFHCHKSHHTMNAMGHDVPTMIGVEQEDIAQKIRSLIPEYMAMGSTGMAEHQTHMEMGHMRLPENTLPMMSGQGQFGPVEMGGMFTTVKVRAGLAANDYRDPGHYKHPAGQVAYEWTGKSLNPTRAPQSRSSGIPAKFQVRKPTQSHEH